MNTITGMDDFPTAINMLPSPLTDGRRVLACVHSPTPGTNEVAYAAAYTLDANFHATRVLKSDAGKSIAVTLCLVDTTLEMLVSEPPKGGGGAESVVNRYTCVLGARMVAVDQASRNQTNAATNMVHATDADVAALDVRLTANEQAIAALEGE